MKKLLLIFTLLIKVFVATSQTITTYGGNGQTSPSANGGLAIQTSINRPYGIALDKDDNLYISENYGQIISKINTDGTIIKVAGKNFAGWHPLDDGGNADTSFINKPFCVALDTIGNFYIADYGNHKIRKVDTAGKISTFCGANVFGGISGNGGPATLASLDGITEVALDHLGNLYLTDQVNGLIRKIDPSGIINNFCSFLYAMPRGMTVDKFNNIYVTIFNKNTIYKVDPAGNSSIIAGNGNSGYSGDGGPATSASLNGPCGITVDFDGNLYIADTYNYRIRKIDKFGIITTIAGNGQYGFSGDGGLATSANLFNPYDVALDSKGNLYISDSENRRIRKVTNIAPGFQGTYSIISQLSIFPNPNNGSFKVQIDNDIKNGQLILINSLGQKVHEQKILQGTNEIKTSGLPFGLYNYILCQDNQTIKNGKVTIE